MSYDISLNQEPPHLLSLWYTDGTLAEDLSQIRQSASSLLVFTIHVVYVWLHFEWYHLNELCLRIL